MARLDDLTVVADIGARYGMHPSWNGFDAALRYIAFEPDTEEADRLRAIYTNNANFTYEVHETALDKQKGERDFHLLKHRGLSSCLKPDLTSECFRHLKPGQAEIEKILKIKTERTDDFFKKLGVMPDFLKVDTEGTEHDVIEGCEAMLETGVLGIRSSCNFQPCFIGQKLFSESHDYLMARGYVLLNLDYKGYGYPRLGLFRKPDPIENEDFRYGILVAADAVWIRKPEKIAAQFKGAAATIAAMKLSYFCFLNNAPDFAVDLLREEAVGQATYERRAGNAALQDAAPAHRPLPRPLPHRAGRAVGPRSRHLHLDLRRRARRRQRLLPADQPVGARVEGGEVSGTGFQACLSLGPGDDGRSRDCRGRRYRARDRGGAYGAERPRAPHPASDARGQSARDGDRAPRHELRPPAHQLQVWQIIPGALRPLRRHALLR